MSKFRIEATFTLGTTVEPDMYRSFDLNAEEFEDNSSFGSDTVTVDGGEVTFVVEAEDEDDAERKAEDVIYSGYEVSDSNNLTWVVDDVSFSVERVEMSKEEALAVIRRLLDRLAEEGRLTSVEREAFDVILQDV